MTTAPPCLRIVRVRVCKITQLRIGNNLPVFFLFRSRTSSPWGWGAGPCSPSSWAGQDRAALPRSSVRHGSLSSFFVFRLKNLYIHAVLRIRIRDEQPGSYFRELQKQYWVKILKFFDADPGWKKFGSGINIPDPQHCIPALFALYVLRFRALNCVKQCCGSGSSIFCWKFTAEMP
jgi:hypothetical protein